MSSNLPDCASTLSRSRTMWGAVKSYIATRRLVCVCCKKSFRTDHPASGLTWQSTFIGPETGSRDASGGGLYLLVRINWALKASCVAGSAPGNA